MTSVLPHCHLRCHQSPPHPPRLALEGTHAPHLRPGVPFRQTVASGRSCPGSSTGHPTCSSLSSGCLAPSAAHTVTINSIFWPRRICKTDALCVASVTTLWEVSSPKLWPQQDQPFQLQDRTAASLYGWAHRVMAWGHSSEGFDKSSLSLACSEVNNIRLLLGEDQLSAISCQRVSPAWLTRARCQCEAARTPWQLHPRHPPPACAVISCYAASATANRGSTSLLNWPHPGQ